MMLFLILLFVTAAQGSFESEDVQALLGFKALIDRSEQLLRSWENSSINSACNPEWEGVRCSQNRVVGLDLSFMSLSCNLSALQRQSPLPSQLRNLSLPANNFTGSIEKLVWSFFPRDCSLEWLDLSGNALSGSISPIINSCRSTLTALNLSHNFLLADLSLNFSGSRLKRLDLSHNNLTGAFDSPADPLEQLHLSHNLFTNFKLNGCHNLAELDISFNSLPDPSLLISSSSSCSSLKKLNIRSASGSGQQYILNISALPQSIQWLDASSNGFISTGGAAQIPSSLQHLDLSSNNLQQLTKNSICSQDSALSKLLLFNNSLSGPIPSSILACANLTILDLSFNQHLSGPIPEQICSDLPNLQQLIIWRSRLDHHIPSQLSLCSHLTTLLLSFNNLSGIIPPQLSQLTRLQWLALSNNNLTGIIPPSLGSLTELAFLELSDNRLEGIFPEGSWARLIWLDLSNNQLSGNVPARFGPSNDSGFSTADFLLSGQIAFAMNSAECNRGLGGLFVMENQMALEEVARSLPCRPRLYLISYLSTKRLSSPVFIDLSFNTFSGGIPEQIGEMRELGMFDLRHNNLTGSIPSSLGHLSSLMLLDLSHNSLSGSLPQSLCNLTFLSSLNVSNNHLSGQIPQRGQLTTFPAESYQSNPQLCGFPLQNSCSSNYSSSASRASSHHRHRFGWPEQLLVSTLVCGITAMVALACWIGWNKMMNSSSSIQFLAEEADAAAAAAAATSSVSDNNYGLELGRLSYREIEVATESFKSMIGSGGSGQVFKGQLNGSTTTTTVAVKRLLVRLQSEREFVAEMETLGKVKHPNLVPLLGFCKWREERILVYEFMNGGNVEQLLANPNIEIPWQLRKKIAKDAARGLCFLHHSCAPHIIHRDIKSSNILLDSNLEAKVSDFGMARLMDSSSETHLSVTTLSGTPGYVPPEYYQSFRCTRSGDVYSYGVILLELLSRKKPTDKDEFGDTNLVGWVKARIRSGRTIQVLDPELRKNKFVTLSEFEEIASYLRVALTCVEDEPHKRPSMLQLVAKLKELSLAADSQQPEMLNYV